MSHCVSSNLLIGAQMSWELAGAPFIYRDYVKLRGEWFITLVLNDIDYSSSSSRGASIMSVSETGPLGLLSKEAFCYINGPVMPFMDHEAFSEEALTLIYSSYTCDKCPVLHEYKRWWWIQYRRGRATRCIAYRFNSLRPSDAYMRL